MTAFDPIDDLIGKVLANEATPAEQEQLSAWLSQSETNRIYYNQIKTVFEKAAAIPVQMKFDEDEAWQKVKSKIRKEKQGRVRVMSSSTLIRIAAGVALMTVASYIIYQWTKPVTHTTAINSGRKIETDTLPDGSIATLNKNSTLNFESGSRDNMRKVKLTGEAYFEVKHETEKPFVIEAEDVLVKDIGTAFNVKAYSNSDTVVVTVESGEVQFYTLKDPGLQLKAGESGMYNKSLKVFSRQIKADTNILAYKTRIFNFKNTELKKALEMINEIYDSKIELANTAIGSCRLTVNFNNDNIDDIADIIAETLNLRLEKKEGGFVLNGNGCPK